MSEENQEQIDYWNNRAGKTWTELQERTDHLLHPFSQEVIVVAEIKPNEKVLDVGCGCGATSLAISELGAAVTGVDVSTPMLDLAKKRAKKVSFIETDASTYQSDQKFDLVFSRFGVMFFSDPYKAFSNLHSITADNGRLAFVCWQSPQKNPWMAIPGQVIRPFIPETEAQPDPKAPGPFAFADPIYLEDILLKSGFKDPTIADFKSQLHVADSIEEAVFFQTKIGPGARVLAEIDDPAIRKEALDKMGESLAPYQTSKGVYMEGAVWIVTART